jgi:putative Ig domain-containing protein
MRPPTRRGSSSVAVVITAIAVACGGDSSTSGGTTTPPVVTAPAGLSYATAAASYTVGTAVAANTPSSSGGAVASYSVQPALPAGLTLNTTTGVISGTPTAVAAIAIYVVTASNGAGSTTASITISVRRGIASFAVGPDIALTYPNAVGDANRILDLPDEHTSFIPIPGGGANAYLVFGASKLASTATGGAIVLQTSDLQTFSFATGLGYNRQVFFSPVPIDACNATYASEFDENYAAPGSVVQDPTLPAGNLIMLYEAENHCPGGVNQHFFYATTGFARSSDNGKTWPAPIDSVLGGSARHPVLKSVNPQPSTNYPSAMGDAIPSGFVDKAVSGDYYLYVVYGFHDGGFTPTSDNRLRIARAKLGADPLVFSKWYNGGFTQTGIGGLDSDALPAAGCTPNTLQQMGEITYNDDLGVYLFIFVCTSGPTGSRVASWYYATATSLDLEDWSTPQPIQNSQGPVTIPCPNLTTGQQYDGFYPSFMSPGAAAGHTKLTGKVFFLNGCDTGVRTFTARNFTITAQ